MRSVLSETDGTRAISDDVTAVIIEVLDELSARAGTGNMRSRTGDIVATALTFVQGRSGAHDTGSFTPGGQDGTVGKSDGLSDDETELVWLVVCGRNCLNERSSEEDGGNDGGRTARCQVPDMEGQDNI